MKFKCSYLFNDDKCCIFLKIKNIPKQSLKEKNVKVTVRGKGLDRAFEIMIKVLLCVMIFRTLPLLNLQLLKLLIVF